MPASSTLVVTLHLIYFILRTSIKFDFLDFVLDYVSYMLVFFSMMYSGVLVFVTWCHLSDCVFLCQVFLLVPFLAYSRHVLR